MRSDFLALPLLTQDCDAQFLLVRMTQDMCLEASRKGRNAKRQVLHLVMLTRCVRSFCGTLVVTAHVSVRHVLSCVVPQKRCGEQVQESHKPELPRDP